MMRSIRLTLALAIACAALPAAASPSSDLVMKVIATVSATNKASATRPLWTGLDQYFDFTAMAANALKGDDQLLPEPQRLRYLDSYRRLVDRFLARRVGKIVPNELTVAGERPLDAARNLVVTRFSAGDRAGHDILWVVRTAPDLRVIDVGYDGVFAGDIARREFAVILQRHAGDFTVLPDAIDKLNP